MADRFICTDCGGTSVAGLVALTFNWRIGAEILAGVVAATALGVLVFLVFIKVAGG